MTWLRMMKWGLATLLLMLAAAEGGQPSEAGPLPLPRAHAHNDYRHERPLMDALAHGFCSVEADIFLIDGQILVGHDRGELRADRTLQALYLDPLRQRVTDNQGHVFPGVPRFTLLIDIKSDGVTTFRALHDVLTQYRAMLTRFDEGKTHRGAVTVIISGNRAVDEIGSHRVRCAAIDGRLSDLAHDRPVDMMPLISDNWRNHFSWRGIGTFPEEEKVKLRNLVNAAHDQHKRIRFWATPDNEAAWRVLHEAKVDLINTDDLAGLQRFLARRRPARSPSINQSSR